MKPALTGRYILTEALDDYAFGAAVAREADESIDWSSLFFWYDTNWHEGYSRVGRMWPLLWPREYPQLGTLWEWFHSNDKAVDHGSLTTFEGWGASLNDPLRLLD